jgi:hypothetical protein
MAVDFPASPTVGQIFNARPGVSFVYRSTGWTRAPLKTALPKNYIVNPAVQISQERDVAPVTVGNAFAADQWSFYFDSGAHSYGRVAKVTPNGSPYRLRLTVTTPVPTLGTFNILYLYQKLEGQRIADLQFGTANAKNIIVRIGLNAPVGTYSLTIQNTNADRTYITPIIVTQGGVDKEYIFAVPGDITGTWRTDYNAALLFNVYVACGTGYLGTANVWTASSIQGATGMTNGMAAANVFELFDVGLYADPYKTGVAPPFVMPDFAAELRHCQRYWSKQFCLRGIVASGTVISRAGSPHKTPMRVTPVAAIVGTPRFWDSGVTPNASSLGQVSNEFYTELDVTTVGTFTVAGRTAVQYWQDETAYIALSARM